MIFFPLPNVQQSIECLDTKTLHHQVTHKILPVAKGRWPKHKITEMFYNRTYFLCQVGMDSLQELRHHGRYAPQHFDTLHDIQMKVKDTGYPPWWGNPMVHDSHKAELLRRYPEHYKQYNWNISTAIPYYFPTFDKQAALKSQPSLV